MRVTRKISRDANPAVLGTSLVAGLGLILAVTALAVGVIWGSTQFTGLLLAAGVLLFILGLVGWFGLAQPYKHFDDINVPAPDEHHHDDHHDDHAIEPAPDTYVETSHH
ncbi:MAG: hypothetical protein HZC41_20790 [Chloroflexi bacterium]|nr:hypothetical protein [Chloroflexota bacterium]